MPRTKAGKRQSSRHSRAHHNGNQKRNQALSKQRISGGGRTRTNVTTPLVYSSTYLKQDLQSISYFAISNRYNEYVLAELLTKVYKLLKNAPGFVDDRQWPTYPALHELSDYLFKKIGEVTPNGFYWNLTKQYSNDYVLIYFKPMPELDNHIQAVPLEWVQEYKGTKLYDFIRYVVYAVQKDFNLMYVLHELTDNLIFDPESEMSGDPDMDELLKMDIEKYKKGGEVHEFMKESKQLYERKDLHELLEAITYYTPKGNREKAIKMWLLKGIDILSNPINIYQMCYPYEDPESENGTPLMPYHNLCFEWSFYDSIFTHGDNWREAMGNEIGYVEPVSYGVITDKKHTPPVEVDNFKALIDFMHQGRELYFKYFNKKISRIYDKRG